METIQLKARAKINWTLDVVGKRPDGYHDVEMVLQAVELHDRITIRQTQKGIKIRTDSPDLPLDRRNLAYRAAELMQEYYGTGRGVEIEIQKKIPIAAGLAGGSTDAAAVLFGLNALWKLGLSLEKLKRLGACLGADVPFCIAGGTALARGIGEILTPLKPPLPIPMVLVKPPFGVSTKEVYGRLKWDTIEDRPDTKKMIESLRHRDLHAIGAAMKNVLEPVTSFLHPQISSIKEEIAGCGAVGCLMSGSGPTVYGIFEAQEQAEAAFLSLKRKYDQVILTRTSGKGIEIVEEEPDGKNQCGCTGREQR